MYIFHSGIIVLHLTYMLLNKIICYRVLGIPKHIIEFIKVDALINCSPNYYVYA